jgi:hypothetical protein
MKPTIEETLLIKELRYVSFKHLIRLFCAKTGDDYTEVVQHLMGWQGGFGKSGQTLVLLPDHVFLHYMEALGSQWMLDKKIPGFMSDALGHPQTYATLMEHLEEEKKRLVENNRVLALMWAAIDSIPE